MEGLNGHFCHGFYPQVRPKSPFFMLLVRCALTVCLMCPAMSLIATFLFKEYREAGLVSVFLQTAAFNFPMALCWQIFFAGLAGR